MAPHCLQSSSDSLASTFDRLTLVRYSCSCEQRCADPDPAAAAVERLCITLLDCVRAQSPDYNNVLGAIVAIPASASALASAATRDAPAPQLAAAHADEEATSTTVLNWLEGLGADLFGIVLCHCSIAGVGAAAATCRMLSLAACAEELWLAQAQRQNVDVVSATEQRCRAMCRDLCSRARLDRWLHAVDATSRDIGAAMARTDDLKKDAYRRFARLTDDDFGAACTMAAPPAELALAAQLLYALWGDGDADAHSSAHEAGYAMVLREVAAVGEIDGPRGSLTWLRRLLLLVDCSEGESPSPRIREATGKGGQTGGGHVS